MKAVLHTSKKEVFETWVNDFCLEKRVKYIWPQICYHNQTGEVIHLVFEKNHKNKDVIEWPVKLNFKSGNNIPVTNIDFTTQEPTLDNGQRWEYETWYETALGGSLQKNCGQTPFSFWNWRTLTWPQGNLTCDMDFLFFKKSNNTYYGFEATEIYHVDKSANKNLDVYEHFERLLKLRKGSTNGFNTLQLKAQLNLLSQLEGALGLILHQIVEEVDQPTEQNQVREMAASYSVTNDKPQFKLRDDKVVTLKINDETVQNIRKFLENPSENSLNKEKSELRFQSLVNVMSRIVE
ncbi:TPA: hypothetical protein O4G41_002650 [Vibrio alginolyticus]|uniref:Uncharacterized protein n=1 Tax=Vibrio diabolicus TaxID=50719 RepID=A0AAX1XH60_9VIBR|nr:MULTISPECIES: hypothetical protein [Vibrio harveyi group]EGQ9112932.1 hypothetical protein [Vibrio alginolyticus]MBS9894276.1 hypothetical protein [Vibrio alginolyticus]MCR9442930.1 hypothetical protein [Vibrio alginolyticus]MCR9447454.1 hypothetical protein [Vibrio alginolyticus]MCR9456624.1 hypothetical protein [Vibrio alginolyticus]